MLKGFNMFKYFRQFSYQKKLYISRVKYRVRKYGNFKSFFACKKNYT